MFGLFMLILFIVVWFAANIQTNNDVRNRKKRAKEKGQEFYLDRNGTMVDTKTDVPYDYQKIDGDVWKVNAYTRKPIKNMSEERRWSIEEKERKKAIEEGKSIYPFEGEIRDTHSKDKIQGRRYKDLKTGEIYVKRKYNNIVFLFNVNTKKLERIDDGSRNEDGYWIYENGQLIKGISEKDIVRYCNEKYLIGNNDEYGNLHKVW